MEPREYRLALLIGAAAVAAVIVIMYRRALSEQLASGHRMEGILEAALARYEEHALAVNQRAVVFPDAPSTNGHHEPEPAAEPEPVEAPAQPISAERPITESRTPGPVEDETAT